jgi:hypothetical protein
LVHHLLAHPRLAALVYLRAAVVVVAGRLQPLTVLLAALVHSLRAAVVAVDQPAQLS